MTGRNFAFIGCRLIAIYILCSGLFNLEWVVHHLLHASIPAYGMNMNEGPDIFLVFSSLVSILFHTMFFTFLWYKAEVLSKRIFPIETVEKLSIHYDENSLLSGFIAVLGLFFIVRKLPEFIGGLVVGLNSDFDKTSLMKELDVHVFLISLIIGIILLLFSSNLSGLINKLRYFGLDSKT